MRKAEMNHLETKTCHPFFIAALLKVLTTAYFRMEISKPRFHAEDSYGLSS